MYSNEEALTWVCDIILKVPFQKIPRELFNYWKTYNKFKIAMWKTRKGVTWCGTPYYNFNKR